MEKRKASSHGETTTPPSKQQKKLKQSTIQEFLKDHSVKNLLEEKKKSPSSLHRPLILSHHQTVGRGMDTLAQFGILSAPVVLAASVEDDDSGSYLGIFDVSSVLFHLVRDKLKGEKKKELKGNHLEEIGREFFKQLLISVTGEDTSMVFRGELDGSIFSLIQKAFLGKSSRNNVHRVTIFNSRGTIVGILSQSDILRYIENHSDVLESLKNKKIKDCGFLKSVVTIPEDSTVLDALFSLYQKDGISALGITDKEGKLIANFSASDLRGISSKDFSLFDLSILEFLKIQKKKHSHSRSSSHNGEKEEKIDLVSVLEEDQLDIVLIRLVRFGLHRVYVVDKDGKPIGLISLTDLLAKFVE